MLNTLSASVSNGSSSGWSATVSTIRFLAGRKPNSRDDGIGQISDASLSVVREGEGVESPKSEQRKSLPRHARPTGCSLSGNAQADVDPTRQVCMVDIHLDLRDDPERPEAIELARGWVFAYLTASRGGATSNELSAYIATNAFRLTDRHQEVTLKLLLHGVDYSAETIKHLLGMCAHLQAERDSQDPTDTAVFSKIRDEIWESTKGLDVAEQ